MWVPLYALQSAPGLGGGSVAPLMAGRVRSIYVMIVRQCDSDERACRTDDQMDEGGRAYGQVRGIRKSPTGIYTRVLKFHCGAFEFLGFTKFHELSTS